MAAIRQIEVAAAGDLVREQFAAGQAQFFEAPAMEALVEDVMGVTLDREGRILEKGEVPDHRRIRKVDQDGQPFARLGRKGRPQQARQTESREIAVLVHEC